MTPVLAHAGHWTSSLLYLTPVLLIVVALAVQGLRDRRSGRTEDPGGEPSLDDILDGRNHR